MSKSYQLCTVTDQSRRNAAANLCHRFSYDAGLLRPALKAGRRASKIAPKITIAPVPTEQCEADHDIRDNRHLHHHPQMTVGARLLLPQCAALAKRSASARRRRTPSQPTFIYYPCRYPLSVLASARTGSVSRDRNGRSRRRPALTRLRSSHCRGACVERRCSTAFVQHDRRWLWVPAFARDTDLDWLRENHFSRNARISWSLSGLIR